MSIYTPDVWVILRIDYTEETLYKVMGGWYGGFVNPDSWRLNSGITRVETDGDFYLIHGYSGSVYRAHKNVQRISSLMGLTIAGLQERAGVGAVEVVDIAVLLEHPELLVDNTSGRS